MPNTVEPSGKIEVNAVFWFGNQGVAVLARTVSVEGVERNQSTTGWIMNGR